MTELTDLSETDASNTTITAINIDEGCAPSGINNAIRNTLGLIRRAFKTSIFRLRDSTDQTKLVAFDLSGITTATTRTITIPNLDGGLVLNAGAQTIAGLKDFTTNPKVSGGGIQFPATQVPSADANVLDDYEEGAFTPVIVGSGTVGLGTYSSQLGTYTKIGRTVRFNLSITMSGHTGTGAMRINGLPFAASASQDFVASGWATALTYSGQLVPTVSAGDILIKLWQVASGTAPTEVTMDTVCGLIIGGSYEV